MGLNSYTMNKILSRLSAQDREEMLLRQRAQTDAANRVATIQAIERLTGIAGQLPGAIASTQGADLLEAAKYVGAGDAEQSLGAGDIIEGGEAYAPGGATPVPAIDWAKEPAPGMTRAPSSGIIPKKYNVADTEEDFRRQILDSTPEVMPPYRSDTRHDLPFNPGSIPGAGTLPPGPGKSSIPNPITVRNPLPGAPAPTPAADTGFYKRPNEMHDAFLERLREGVRQGKITDWQAAEIVGRMPTEHTKFPPTSIDATLSTFPGAPKPAAPTPAPMPSTPTAPVPATKPVAQKARMPGEDDIQYGNRLNQMVISGDIDQYEYADLWKRKDEVPMPTPDVMAGGPIQRIAPVPQATKPATPYRAPPGKGPAGPGAALQGTELEDNLAELDRLYKSGKISREEYLKAVKVKGGEVMQAFSESPAEAAPQKSDEDPIVAGTQREAAVQLAQPVRRYAPLKWSRSDREEAEAQLEDIIRLGRPHPLLNLLSFGQAQNRFDMAKAVALKQAAAQIRRERRVAEQDNLARYKVDIPRGGASKTPEQIAAEIALKEAQAELTRKRTEKVGLDVTTKEALKKADRDALVGGKQFLRDSNRLVESGKKLLEKDKKTGKAPGFPFGAVRQAAEAGIEALGSTQTEAGQDQRTRQIGGQIGVSGTGAGASGVDVTTRPVGGKVLNAEQFNDAWEKIDMTKMNSEQRYFMSQLKTVIQSAGKTREGRALTDKDLEFYLKNLVSTNDPSVALRQINQLAEDAAMNYNLNLESLRRATTDGVVPGFDQPQIYTFSPEEISAAEEAAFGETGAWIRQNQPRPYGGTALPIDDTAQSITAPAAPQKKKRKIPI